MAEIGSQDWVVSKIRGVRELLWDVPAAALATYGKIDPALRLPWNPRTVANVLNSYVLDEARRQFAGVKNSRFFDANGTSYHLLNGCALWYKQLGVDGFPSNYPTDLALEMMQGRFSFMPQRILLVVGFQVDDAMQAIKSVVIQRFHSVRQLKFYIELEKVTAKSRVIEMPSHSTVATGTKTRIRIKRGPEQKELIVGENE